MYLPISGIKNLGQSEFLTPSVPHLSILFIRPFKMCVPFILAMLLSRNLPLPMKQGHKHLYERVSAVIWFIISNHWKSASKRRLVKSYVIYTVQNFIELLSTLIDMVFKKVLFIYFQREEKGRRKGEKHQCVVASHTPHTGDLTRNPGMCSDWESNLRPLGSQASTQSIESHQPGQH